MTAGQLQRIFGLAAAYWAAAQLAAPLTLEVAPGLVVSPLWPAAGIAMGALYAWGPGAGLGVLIGSLAFNLGGFFAAGAPAGAGESIASALIIATGATLQAVAGALLARRLVGASSGLEEPSAVVRLLLAGGPVSCLVSATWSVGLMGAMGLLPPHYLAASWLIWWAGDATGAMIFAPLFLTLFGTPADAWRPRRVTVLIPMILCLSAVLLLHAGLRRWEAEQLRRDLSESAGEVTHALANALKSQILVNRSTASLYEAYPETDHDTGQGYLDAVFHGVGGQRAISWVPRIGRDERASYEEEHRRRGLPGHELRELAPDGRVVRARDRDEYFPVCVISPREENTPALGYDIGSERVRADAIAAARKSGETVISGPLQLVQLPDRSIGVLLLTPVYRSNSPRGTRERRHDAILGFISTVLVVGDFVRSTVPGVTVETTPFQYLFDRDPDGRRTLIYAKDGVGIADAIADAPRHVAEIHVGGRTWEAVFLPALDANGLRGNTGWYRHALLWVGGVVVSLIGALLLIVTARRRHLHVIRDAVRSVANGNLGARLPIAPGSPLADIESGINEMIGKISVSQDELERRVAEATAELERKRADAEAATLAKSRVIAYASHDLRQPLHALQLFISHLKQERAAPEAAALIQSIDASAQALVELLDGLLDLYRMESGLIRAARRAVPVADLWDKLHSSFAGMAATKRLQLRLRHSDLRIATDPQLMQRVLLNLVSNAIRYTDKGGVLVACRRRGDHACLQVWDTGRGIPEDLLGEVFKEFVQLDNAERGREKGLGLGLSIVERATRLMGNRLSLRSVPGRGSCFSIEVPLADQAQGLDEPAETAGSIAEADLANCSILVVEDDALARRALVDLLRSWDCVVTEAADAEAALSAIEQGCRPDVIATDLRLPNRGDGISLVRQARLRLGRHVPAFLISGDTGAWVMGAANDAGLPLLHKPVKAARLRTVVQLLLGSAGKSSD